MLLHHARWSLAAVFSLRTPALPLTRSIAPALDATRLYEEERNTQLPLSRYYPMRMGQILNERYQVACKLGSGGRSTVWLARDLHG